MKNKKTIEQLTAVPASSWSYNDLQQMALAIKDNPENNELKNIFLNLDPRTGEYCNKTLYGILATTYCWLLQDYSISYTLDEYIEAVSYYVFKTSLIDWKPGHDLIKHLKYASLPHGPIGRDLSRNAYLIGVTSLDAMPAEDNLLAAESNISIQEHAHDLEDLVNDILAIVHLSELELRLLTDFPTNSRMSKEYLGQLNDVLGTNYTPEEIRAIRDKAAHRVKYHQKELLTLFKKFR